MTEYLQILEESLCKKINVLDEIITLNKRQYEISAHQPMDLEAYDQTMDEKGDLIDKLNDLDDGFVAVFGRVKDDLLKDKETYQEEIARLQELIRISVEKGVTIEAQEQRNKASMEAGLKMKRNEIKQMRKATSVATNYYKAMSNLEHVDPMMMDHHK